MVNLVNLLSGFIFGNRQLQSTFFMPDLTIQGIQGPCFPIVRIPPFSGIGMLITVWNQYVRQNGTLLKLLGRNRRLAKYCLKSSILGG